MLQIKNAKANATTIVDPSWYMEYGAMNHVTSTVNQLNMKSNYNGKQLQV